GGVCYNIAVPTSSANAGSGNIYFQIIASTDFQWVALGTGSGMAGSNIFLMYQDGNGNLTLSPRVATSYRMPTLDTSSTAAQLTLLAGSGVSDGVMTANIACSNCQTWSGGQMSLSDTNAPWIGAWRRGSSLATTNRAANIAQHDGHTQFQVDLTRATIDSDSNPFVEAGNSGSGNNSGGGSSGGGGDSNGGNSKATILVAHGVIMAIVMAVLYPLGSLLMPLLGKWWLHAAWQLTAFCLMWAGFGLGIQTAQVRGMVGDPKSLSSEQQLTIIQLFNQTHTILGTVVICLLAIQPALGYLHHRHYLKTHGRGVISYAHIWWGRILMILGVINGGSGLQLSRERDSLIIAYSVVAGVIFLAYFLFKGWAVFFRNNKAGDASPKVENPPRRPYQESRRQGERYV
ncbi:iron reductase domain protein, partial [Canariomyces notabilis]